MTDLEKELTRQIHEISKEVNALRERIAVLEYKATPVVGTSVVSTRDPWTVVLSEQPWA